MNAAPTAPEPFTVGTYLRARRLAQNVQIGAQDLDLPEAVIEAIETDAREPTLAELGELMMAFEFDISILTAIAHGGQSAIEASEEACRVCGCSYSDPCQHDERGPCSWSEEYDGVCTATACIEKATAAA